MPFVLRAVRWGFPKLEKIAPSLARRYFIKIFFTPLQYKTPEKELVIEKKSEKFFVEDLTDAGICVQLLLIGRARIRRGL